MGFSRFPPSAVKKLCSVSVLVGILTAKVTMFGVQRVLSYKLTLASVVSKVPSDNRCLSKRLKLILDFCVEPRQVANTIASIYTCSCTFGTKNQFGGWFSLFKLIPYLTVAFENGSRRSSWKCINRPIKGVLSYIEAMEVHVRKWHRASSVLMVMMYLRYRFNYTVIKYSNLIHKPQSSIHHSRSYFSSDNSIANNIREIQLSPISGSG